MHKLAFAGIAGLALLGGIGTAAGDAPGNVALTKPQQHIIALGAIGQAQPAPPGFQSSAGAIVPRTLRLYAFGIAVHNVVPAVQPYDYVKLKNQDILLVDPGSRKVVATVVQKNAAGGK